jgi:predicted dehydrogenase
VGVIGIGYLGRFHADKYSAIDKVTIGGLADVEDNYLSEIASRTGADPYRDYRDLIGKVDAVSIVTPTPTHYQIAKFFLEHGVHVLLEKPITTSVSDAKDLIHTAKIKGLILQVGHIERFNPSFIELQSRVSCPSIIEAHRLTTNKERSLCTNVVLDLMVHDVDLISEIVSSEVTELECFGNSIITDSTDVAYARIGFANGCVATVTASRVSQSEVRKFRLFQEDGTYTIDFINKTILESRPDKDHIYRISFDSVDVLEIEIRSFIDSVRLGRPPVVSGEDGLRALELSQKIEAMIQKNHAASISSCSDSSAA